MGDARQDEHGGIAAAHGRMLLDFERRQAPRRHGPGPHPGFARRGPRLAAKLWWLREQRAMFRSKKRGEVQHLIEEDGGLHDGTAERVSAKTGVPAAEVYGVGSFFHLLSRPAAKVRVCTGLSCLMGGAEQVLAAARAAKLPVEECSCLAACDVPPAVLKDRRVLASVRVEDVEASGGDWKKLGGDRGERALARHRRVGISRRFGSPSRTGARFFRTPLPRRPGEGRRRPSSRPSSGRGTGCRGGEGPGSRLTSNGRECGARRRRRATSCSTPTRASPAPSRTREVMMRRPDLVLEGLAIAADAVGARDVYLYLRGEFEIPWGGDGRCGGALPRERRSRRRGVPLSRGSWRLHLRRGDRAARGARRQARHAAPQAALSHGARALGQADPRAQRRDHRLRTGDRRAGGRVVPGARKDRARLQAVLRERRREAAGHVRAAARREPGRARRGGRRLRGRAQGVLARRRELGLSAGERADAAPRLPLPGRDWIDARLGGGRRAQRGRRPEAGRAVPARLLRERELRPVRSVPHRDAVSARRLRRAPCRPGGRRRPRARRRRCVADERGLYLRARAGRPSGPDERDEILPRRAGGAEPARLRRSASGFCHPSLLSL